VTRAVSAFWHATVTPIGECSTSSPAGPSTRSTALTSSGPVIAFLDFDRDGFVGREGFDQTWQATVVEQVPWWMTMTRWQSASTSAM
jgi:hypothetical protein